MHMVLLEAGAGDSLAGGNGGWSMLIMFVPMIAIIYFFMIRPESKRKKKAQQLRNELVVGDEVTTIGGIVGRIISIKDDDVIVETGHDKSQVKVKNWAISSRDEKISN